MATAARKPDAARPIIRKKVKKGGHGHHGGAWKVAYADFVTAMMAFFLLMWLLASMEAGDRAQVANYFQRPLTAIFAGGASPGGDRIISQSEGSEVTGILAPGSEAADATAETVSLEELETELAEEIESNPLLHEFEDQLRFDLTDQGLRIQLVDEQHRPMFAVGAARLEPYTAGVLREIAQFLNDVPNWITVSGHTDATPYAGGEAGYSNWELSVDRANAARRALVAGGISEGKILRVEGLASTLLLDADDPYDPQNRRITILILNADTAEAIRRSGIPITPA